MNHRWVDLPKGVRLLQHDYLDDPWKMMVATIIWNRHRVPSSYRVTQDVLARYPTALALAGADERELKEMLRSVAVHNLKAYRLIRMSRSALRGGIVGSWYGMGRYAIEVWMILVVGAIIWPEDKGLQRYMLWCGNEGVEPPSYQNDDGSIVRVEPKRIMRLANMI